MMRYDATQMKFVLDTYDQRYGAENDTAPDLWEGEGRDLDWERDANETDPGVGDSTSNTTR